MPFAAAIGRARGPEVELAPSQSKPSFPGWEPGLGEEYSLAGLDADPH